MSETKRITKITEKQIKDRGVQALADRPNAQARYGVGGLSAPQLKLWFDKLATFLAGKINEITDVISGEDAAYYIRLALEKYGIDNLGDLITSFEDGTFAKNVVKVFPTEMTDKSYSLSEMLTNVLKSLVNIVYDVPSKSFIITRVGGDKSVISLAEFVGDITNLIDGTGQYSVQQRSSLNSTEASGKGAAAFGESTKASYEASFSGGRHTNTSRAAQTALGEYNTDDPDALLVVGNGDNETKRSNALAVKKDGRVKVGAPPREALDVVTKSVTDGLDDRVKDLEALNLDYLEVEGDSDTGIVQVPSGFWVGSRAFVNSFGGKTYRLGHLPGNMIAYNEQFGSPIDLGKDVIATIENGALKTLSAGYIYVIKPGITVNTTKDVHIVTWLTFAKATTFSIKQSPEADIETVTGVNELDIHNDGQPIILFMESEATITSIRFTDYMGESGRAFIVEPIMYASAGNPKSTEDYQHMNITQQSYCIPGVGGDDYCYFPDWGLTDKDYKPAEYTLSDTKVIAIESHGTNLFDESQIVAVDGDRDGETWGKPVDDEEGRYLLSNRAFEGVGGNKWLGFSMELTPGKYTISADCYISSAPNLKVVFGLRTYEPGESVTNNAELSEYGIWERVSAIIPITKKGTYYLSAMGRGASGNYKNLDVRFKNICITKDGSTNFVPFRGVTGVIDRIDIPWELRNKLDGYGMSCGCYEQPVAPWDIICPFNKVDLDNRTYINDVGGYVFTGEEEMIVRPDNYQRGVWIYTVTVPFPIARFMGMTVECDEYESVENQYSLEEDWAYPGFINVGYTSEVRISSTISSFEEFRKELKGAVLRYVRETPPAPVPIEIDGLIEVEPGGYIEAVTDTGRGVPISVTFVVPRE